MTQGVSSRGRRAGRALVVLGAAAFGLSGCGSASPPVEHRGDIVTPAHGELTAADVGTAQTAFGLDLLHAVCAHSPGENLVLSPTSAAEALGLIYPAAGGTAAEDLGILLHLPQWSPELEAAAADHTVALASLAHEGPTSGPDLRDSLRLSNRIWTAPGVEPVQAYLDAAATAFGAAVYSVDFPGDPQGATDQINDAVREDTAGLIDGLFDEPLSAGTRVVLTDALHLQARWSVPFRDTAPTPFDAPVGLVSVEMMTGALGVGHAAAGWQAVDLSYREETLSATAILPPVGTDPCAIDSEALGALADAEPHEVDVALPRVTIEQTHRLLDPLRELGLPVDGDFSGFGEEGLVVSEIVQKTYLAVDEDGTVAAAATGGAMTGSAPLGRELVQFDHPYLLLLTDTATGSPLFIAIVADPSS